MAFTAITSQAAIHPSQNYSFVCGTCPGLGWGKREKKKEGRRISSNLCIPYVFSFLLLKTRKSRLSLGYAWYTVLGFGLCLKPDWRYGKEGKNFPPNYSLTYLLHSYVSHLSFFSLQIDFPSILCRFLVAYSIFPEPEAPTYLDLTLNNLKHVPFYGETKMAASVNT